MNEPPKLRCLVPSCGGWKPPLAPFAPGDGRGRLRANVTAGDFRAPARAFAGKSPTALLPSSSEGSDATSGEPIRASRRGAATLLAAGAALLLPAPPALSAEDDDLLQDDVIEITEAQVKAVERGLDYLARYQNPDGSWTSKIGFKLNNNYEYTAADRGHVGVSALACMAFLAGGHTPGRGEHGDVIDRGLDFILSCVKDDGYITYAGTRMYSHAFATLFLAEVYGMTHRDDVKRKLQKAVDFIVKSQNTEGGWRYVPLARESDMSIVVCQVLALRAARNIGIRVPKSTIDAAANYVVASAVTDERPRGFHNPYRNDVGTFHYQKDHYSRSSFALTSAGVTALHGLGIYSDHLIQKGIEYLNRDFAKFNSYWGRSGHYFFWYGHYYGVQAMHTQGGRDWREYFTNLRRFLLDMQHADGSWPNDEGPGPIYGTATAVLILEIPYGFLPIFQR